MTMLLNLVMTTLLNLVTTTLLNLVRTTLLNLTICNWPKPRKVKDIQSFLGFVNFYC